MQPGKVIALLLSMIMMIASAALAGPADTLAFQDMPGLIRPGKTERISFFSPIAGEARIELLNIDGTAAYAIKGNLPVQEGSNSLYWSGLDENGNEIRQAEYILALTLGDTRLGYHVKVGPASPQLTNLQVSEPVIMPGQAWHISATVNMPGILRVMILGEDQKQSELLHQQVAAGEILIPWDGTLNGAAVQPGTGTLSLLLTDSEGFTSSPYHLVVRVQALPEATPRPSPAPEPYKIPSLQPIPQGQMGTSYWTSPVGKWDEKAIWDIMMQPMTVIVGRDQRETYKLRATPDSSSAAGNILGEITYVSQGVHVLETLDNGWTLIEANNSSYGPDNRSRRGYGKTDEIIQGYVETKYLERVTPRTDYGILIDKLKQEMYVFKDGKLFSTLSISTGVPTKQQPWNETPSGEYLMVSRVGDFMAGNLYCAMAMRINGGSLLHEVPYILNQTTGWKDYTIQERQLGTKASHGCVRVQRKPNSEGLNMTWLWNNIKVNTKVLVWDDTNRRMAYPPDDLMLYFNPDNGQYYHSDQNCPSIRDRFLPLKGSFTYAELEDAEHGRLSPCTSCNPPVSKSEIDRINFANGF
ncbi:MAG: L,D-transpeptidase [Christensenellales bacterium]